MMTNAQQYLAVGAPVVTIVVMFGLVCANRRIRFERTPPVRLSPKSSTKS